ncbi:hypothetical protein JCM8202v2_004498 [Rhodotorula sphaerocarpa]
MPPPLKGIKIVDLTRVLAGPYATANLPPSAPLVQTPPTPPPSPKMGAEDEPQLRVEDWNSMPPESAYFLQANRGKRSLTLDFKKEAGKEVLRALIKEADVLVENYVPGKLGEMGFSFEECKKINPRLIYASISGYGQTGPSAKTPGYDVIIEAEAGLMHITGEADGPPVKVGVAVTDLACGLYAKSAILAALLSRATTGQGVHIDANLFDSQLSMLANIGSNYLIAGQEATRQGTAHPSIVPYQVLPTQDSFIMIAGANDGQFSKLAKLLGHPEWSTDAQYSTNSARVANRTSLIPLISAALAEHPTSHWLETFKGQGFPFAPVNNIRQSFEHPQTQAREMVTEVDHPRAGKVKLVSPAVQYNGHRMAVTRPPPVLAQHTVEVLRELGYEDRKIAELQQQNVV